MTASPQALLEVKNLSIEFLHRKGNLQAIHELTLSMQPGEILGMVGESGAGKSLTGAAIAGLLQSPGRIRAGEIWFANRRIDNLDEEARRLLRGKAIGCIFQDPLTSLNPVLTIGQQLIETIRTHLPLSANEARERAVSCLLKWELIAHVSVSINIHTSSRVECVSAWSLRWRCALTRNW